jgi:Zn ribbon nucleic-acid-binding protein
VKVIYELSKEYSCPHCGTIDTISKHNPLAGGESIEVECLRCGYKGPLKKTKIYEISEK